MLHYGAFDQNKLSRLSSFLDRLSASISSLRPNSYLILNTTRPNTCYQLKKFSANSVKTKVTLRTKYHLSHFEN